MSGIKPGFEVVVDALADAGVSTVFGLMGDDTAAMISDLPRRQIRYVPARHENLALAMADGYAWATDDISVVIISRGPGLTNAMTGLVSIARRSAKVVVIVGDAPSRASGSHKTDPKSIDQVALAEAADIRVTRVIEPEAVLDAVTQSIHAAKGGHPTLLIVPSDIQAATVGQHPAPTQLSPNLTAPEADEDALDQAAAALTSASAPLILAGSGAHRSGAGDALRRLAEKSGALLGTTLLGKGLFEGDPFSLGIIGGFASESALQLVEQSDVVLVVGASLSTFTTERGRLFSHAKRIHVDLNPEVIEGRAPDLGIVGDANAVVQALNTRLEPQTTTYRTSANAETILNARARTGKVSEGPGGLHPEDLVRRLDQLLPEDRVVVTDGGHNLGYPPMYLAVKDPDHFRHSYFFGAVGMGLGVALGAATADKRGRVVLVVGDGGLSMVLGDLSTAVEYHLPLTVIVLNDRAYGAERHFLDLIGRPTELSSFAEVDFAAVATALGWQAHRVATSSQFDQTALVLSEPPSGPVLLDIRVDPDVRASWINSGMVQGHDGD